MGRCAVVKDLFDAQATGPNLLSDDKWQPWEQGFERQGGVFVCDNGNDNTVHRGVGQTVELNQDVPRPIIAVAWSKAEGISGGRDNNYSLYLDLLYADGTPLWGQTAPFSVGTHDWERRQVVIFPSKPVKQVSFYMLLRRHTGKASFRDPVLYQLETPKGAAIFDGLPVTVKGRLAEGFQVRDVAANTGFSTFEGGKAFGLTLESERQQRDGATFIRCRIADTTGKDRAITLVYTVPVGNQGWRWLADPRRSLETQPPVEYHEVSRFAAGAIGALSRYPLAAIARGNTGRAIGLDMGYPAFYRVGYSAGTGELFIAYDLGLTPEKPSAELQFCLYDFDAAWGFRSALDRYYRLFPELFRCRTPEQGLWMPFAKISQVEGWQDFGFKFKEGNDETAWDDANNIITFRYTEPMTWWMRMPEEMPRTMEAAVAEAKRLAGEGNRQAQALLASGYHDTNGQFVARLLDTPWCNGAVWSMNSAPGVPGETTDFLNKWSPKLREQLYGPERKGDLDGEYIDSSEGYVTDELNFRREHFAGMKTPLTFDIGSHRPAIFRGLIAYEYARAMAEDVHRMGKLMMANSTPSRLPWLAAYMDVLGTETNWNPRGNWQPMSDADLLYRRAMCATKPYCFLMNTDFNLFSHELVEKYMKRSLAYGMFPGFFSADASTNHYFRNPALYNRDRPLFKKYVPLCKRVAEAGWRPITGAVTSDPQVYVERFGDRYLTLFNDSSEEKRFTVTLQGKAPAASRDLVTGQEVRWRAGGTLHGQPAARAEFTLKAEDVAVIEF